MSTERFPELVKWLQILLNSQKIASRFKTKRRDSFNIPITTAGESFALMSFRYFSYCFERPIVIWSTTNKPSFDLSSPMNRANLTFSIRSKKMPFVQPADPKTESKSEQHKNEKSLSMNNLVEQCAHTTYLRSPTAGYGEDFLLCSLPMDGLLRNIMRRSKSWW